MNKRLSHARVVYSGRGRWWMQIIFVRITSCSRIPVSFLLCLFIHSGLSFCPWVSESPLRVVNRNARSSSSWLQLLLVHILAGAAMWPYENWLRSWHPMTNVLILVTFLSFGDQPCYTSCSTVPYYTSLDILDNNENCRRWSLEDCIRCYRDGEIYKWL